MQYAKMANDSAPSSVRRPLRMRIVAEASDNAEPFVEERRVF
jgi:hypothetical protein